MNVEVEEHSLCYWPYINDKQKDKMSKKLLVMLLMGSSSMAYAEGSAWILDDGATSLGISVISGSSRDFFIGETSTDLGGDLEGTFIWLDASRGYEDIWAFDIRTGYARTQFETNPEEQSDISDTSLGVTYQFLNEFEQDNGSPTISGRLGYTIGGDYETDLIDAIGDGASGFDVSLLVGKNLAPSFSLSGDLTYRQRDNDVADAVKFLLSGNYAAPLPGLSFQLGYGLVRTDSDIDIGGPGFGVEQFSQTDRDSDWLITSANYGFSNGIGINFSLSTVLDGRNVADTDIATFSLSYSL